MEIEFHLHLFPSSAPTDVLYPLLHHTHYFDSYHTWKIFFSTAYLLAWPRQMCCTLLFITLTAYYWNFFIFTGLCHSRIIFSLILYVQHSHLVSCILTLFRVSFKLVFPSHVIPLLVSGHHTFSLGSIIHASQFAPRTFSPCSD